jgi:hypothetical protein
VVVADLRAKGEAMTIAAADRTRWILLAGALLGLALAARGLVEDRDRAVPPGAVAMVGDVPITREEYARTLAAVASDRRDGTVDPALGRHVLDRLVDEEILVQAALAGGFALRDPALRGQIASAMIDAVVGDRAPPSDEALRAHFESHAGVFARNGRVRVTAVWFSGASANARANAARARMSRGEAIADADPPAVTVPASLLPQIKLADYLGPSVAAAVADLPEGGVTAPIETPTGLWVVRLAERRDGETPSFESVRDQVAADYRREQDDRALRRWLDRRRKETRVAVRDPLP